MRDLTLSTRILSEAIWARIFEHSALRFEQRRHEFFSRMADLDSLRLQADYNTGSVSAATCWVLYAVAHYFAPIQIVEIGTFIGRTALAMAQGLDDAGVAAEIHTCDLSNDIALPQVAMCALLQYPKKSSTDMLEQMRKESADWQIELIHLDGRLQSKDIEHLRYMCVDNVVVALDDFEGTEKGVANYTNIRASGWLQSHVLVYPPNLNILMRLGVRDESTTALLIPSKLLKLTNQ